MYVFLVILFLSVLLVYICKMQYRKLPQAHLEILRKVQFSIFK